MNIRSIDNTSFNSRSDRDLTPYNPRKNRRHNIDTIIAMDDNQVKRLAYLKTLNKVEDKKHHDASNAMIMATPFAAGAASALLGSNKVKLFSKDITGPFARGLKGLGGAGRWGILLGVAYGISKARQYFENKSQNFDRFTSENPLLTAGASIAAFAGAIALGAKGVSKIAEQSLKHINPKSIIKFDNKLADFSDKFNKNQIVSKAAKLANRVKNIKGIEPLQVIAQKALSWSPAILLGGAFLNEWVHGRATDAEFVKNYAEMKNIQTKLAQARINELAVQNRVLKSELASEHS